MNKRVSIPLYDETGIDSAVREAFASFETYKRLPVTDRISFLEQVAEEISGLKETLVSTAHGETFLPANRLNGEIDRTINQIRMFASLLKEGTWVNAVIDTAMPDRVPLSRPDIRQMQQPLGVTGVFGAGNFPFAFSVAGGDTIAALAAGCPVVYKVHNGHPLTSQLVAECIYRAAGNTGMPAGVFSMVITSSKGAGIGIVTHPLVKAVAFTGSFAGGKALWNAANGREEPIPVYAEMGSVNPVFLLPDKLKEATDGIAQSLAISNTLGTGQFCTNPGILIMLKSPQAEQFSAGFQKCLSGIAGGTMLTASIYHSYSKGIAKLKAKPNLAVLEQGKNNGLANEGIPQAFRVQGRDFLLDKELAEECFGPSSLHVVAEDKEQLLEIAANLPGQLTASVWATAADCKAFTQLFHILESKAGRVVVNNVPTGVEVTHAMLHGGPYPATTDSKFTSVGSRAIYRFTRPVCYQDYPPALLPQELQDTNPLGIWRMINGEFTKE